ncbi:unnamed protein product [Adineta ricciae]|uniref:Uncharacterized protein n=1 Tax=Adineta ricciae TaxID=249248 RepID=A0A816B5Q3_ADIRI|nr:unnamed protein product [Adineta ricciae]
MQRVCFCKTVSLFNHVLQPSQALALFYQSLLFSLKNLALIRWISSTIDIPTGLQLLMIDINGNVTIDDDLIYKQLANTKHEVEQQQLDTTSILKWISRIVLRLASDCSISSKSDRSIEFESFNDFLKQFHTTSSNDRSTLSDDDEGISNDDLDDEDISRRAIYRALMKCIEYMTSNSLTNSSNSNENKSNISEMQDFESNAIALYNQEIIQILCSDTLELEIELARDSRQPSFELSSTPPLPHNNRFYSTWSSLWRDVTVEYLQFNDQNRLRKVSLDNYGNLNGSTNEIRRWSMRENDRILDEISRRHQNLRKTSPLIRVRETNLECLHDRLMSEIKQQRILKPIGNDKSRLLNSTASSLDSSRKRIRPVKATNESDLSSDDEQRDEHGRKRVAVIDCLLESSPSSPEDDVDSEATIKSKCLMKDSSNTLSLTFDEFSHIRNVITRAELETLLFNEKLYAEVAQGKLCFTCRKVHFNLLTFTFGIQCNVCKQKVCRSCVTQIALPKERLNDIPIQSFTPLTLSKGLHNSERSYSLDNQSPLTPVMNDVIKDFTQDDVESRRSSTPANAKKLSEFSKRNSEPIDICTDCFFLLQQLRKKSRQRHIDPPILPPTSSSSSSFNRSYHSSSRSTSNYNLSSSSSASSVAALLAQQQHHQNALMMKSNSKQELVSSNNDPLQNLTTIGATGGSQRVTLSRRHLFLKLQPSYDVK